MTFKIMNLPFSGPQRIPLLWRDFLTLPTGESQDSC